MAIHTFGSSSEAYDAVQTSEHIRDGDILHIPFEEVVGVAYTWPFAVTYNNGSLHCKQLTSMWEQVCASTGIPVEKVQAAVTFASQQGYRLAL